MKGHADQTRGTGVRGREKLKPNPGRPEGLELIRTNQGNPCVL